ncbi:hypothetical protein RHGRI_019796 [Rhododendron griersonianum]|uniref:Fe2OG dioxygenase domain-containing protein n=1 Tax=Rhododendron griersonianum TaxID=479676 RepID=A0AAV6JI88_9ERIC|nr:hypothetical protein RHGRI_019796 [Rhododendron griersonianum]KAG5539364.1 hypothetical protein RHGRI_019796 [Rhododendron griersonianum]
MDVGWLRQLFTPFGRVEDVYMPSKRSSSFNTKFGFVRFKRREEAINAIEDLDGVAIRNFTIVVQFAKYSKDNPVTSQMNLDGVKKVNPGPSIHSWQPKPTELQSKQRASNSSSYADILKGGSSGRLKLVEAKEVGLGWLQKSAVGKLINFCHVNTLQDLFISNGTWDAQIRHMGGLNVLISFDSIESLNDFLKDETKVLSKWFSSVQAWDNQKIPPSRCVWISCYGVPLNAWCSSTFIEIGKFWGDVIKLDELTEKSIAFDKGRMFIITDYLDCINEVVHVKINGVIFPVKVIEDPMAETSWEKRVFTSIKIKKGNDKEVKEAVVETDPGDDESLDFDVDKAELENEMEFVEEVAETNVEVEKAIGTEERALQLINVNMQGSIDKAANSSSGVEASGWGSGKIMDSMRETAANNTTLNINFDPPTFVRLNMCIQIPRASLSILADNQDSWVEDSVKENPVIDENLRGENDEDEIIPEHHTEAYRIENEPHSTSIKAAINGVKNHGVPETMIENVHRIAREFFRLPESERLKNYSDDPSKTTRLKEVAEYCTSVRGLTLRLLGAISESLGLDRDYVSGQLGSHGQHMAMNYYPPCPEPELTYGLPGHTDPNLITILLQDDVPGLQVLHKGKWVAVNPIPNTFIINIGDQMQVISNDRYKSVLHRAVVNSDRERISIPTFYCPSPDAVIGSAPELVDDEDRRPAVYKKFTYQEYYDKFWNRGFATECCLDMFKV